MFPSEVTSLPTHGLQTVWFSPENPEGRRNAGGQTNHGRKGRPSVSLRAGETIALAELPGEISGTLRRIWLTIDDRSPEMLRGLRLEGRWDGATEPAISAPLGDFFGQMCGQMAVFESAFFGSPEARSFWCTLPMPFRAGMRLSLTNATRHDLAYLFYDVNVTSGETQDPNTGYIHAVARRENPTTLQRDYELLPLTTGRGRFLGVHLGVVADGERYGGTWWGEGEVKFYVDGDSDFPTLCGTGTEDYIATGWGQGSYAQAFHGSPLADDRTRSYGFYRWHLPDPIFFHESLRVTIQQIGHCFGDGRRFLRDRVLETGEPVYVAGTGLIPANLADDGPASGVLFERQDDWSSVAFLLLDRPA
ncbi:MAG: DUF2961 domain-containing protein [Akkermansiaceae bacterium]|nr:DUF2961 domain-containing protein [Armatimonadota bacterium]